jgi:hypothetical protein
MMSFNYNNQQQPMANQQQPPANAGQPTGVTMGPTMNDFNDPAMLQDANMVLEYPELERIRTYNKQGQTFPLKTPKIKIKGDVLHNNKKYFFTILKDMETREMMWADPENNNQPKKLLFNSCFAKMTNSDEAFSMQLTPQPAMAFKTMNVCKGDQIAVSKAENQAGKNIVFVEVVQKVFNNPQQQGGGQGFNANNSSSPGVGPTANNPPQTPPQAQNNAVTQTERQMPYAQPQQQLNVNATPNNQYQTINPGINITPTQDEKQFWDDFMDGKLSQQTNKEDWVAVYTNHGGDQTRAEQLYQHWVM